MRHLCVSFHRVISLSLALLLGAIIASTVTSAQQPPAPQVVDLTASDGVHLKATYFAAAQPGPGILLLHQCNRQRKVWDDLATRLAASGLNVLTLDFRGFGESEGTPLDKMTPREATIVFKEKFPLDVDTAFQYLTSQPGVAREVIGAGGASCGVNQSVQLARRHPQVKALVLLSEGTDPAGRQFLRDSPHLPLFMAAADDDPDPGVVEIMQWLYSFSSYPLNKFDRYSTGGHGVEMFDAHKELPGEIVAWFNVTLRESAAPVLASARAHHSSGEPQFLEVIDHPGGPAKATQLYASERKRNPKAVLFSEAVMNRLGYEHLQDGDTKGAVELMKLNVAAYSKSANVYDSLSDAYLADGQKDLARLNAKKALELLPSDTTDPEDRRKGIKESAEQKLKQLGDSK
jgi:dienelactone hydrolase